MTRCLTLSLLTFSLLLTAGCGLRPDPSARVEHTGQAPGPGQGGGADGM